MEVGFYSLDNANPCVNNYNTFAAAALNNAITTINAEIAGGFPFTLPRLNPNSNAAIDRAIRGHFVTVYLRQMYNFTQSCGTVSDPPGAQAITPFVNYIDISSSGIDFSARRDSVGC